MSDNYLRIIPADENLVPSDEVVAQVLELIAPAFAGADEILSKRHRHPVFIDPGEGLLVVLCPACDARLPLRAPAAPAAVREWWSLLAGDLARKGAGDVRATMPCCRKLVPFSRLRFDAPAGVAAFEISILNPPLAQPPSPEVQEQLAAVLGCPVRFVWARY